MQDSSHLETIIQGQLKRRPRKPYRVAKFGPCGYPYVLVSPSVLEDGTPFPTWVYLVCPKLCAAVSEIESAGGVAKWAKALEQDANLRAALKVTNKRFKTARLQECLDAGQPEDRCEKTGLSGQSNIFGVKCLHAHVAYELVGLDDPIGKAVLSDILAPVEKTCATMPHCKAFEQDLKKEN